MSPFDGVAFVLALRTGRGRDAWERTIDERRHAVLHPLKSTRPPIATIAGPLRTLGDGPVGRLPSVWTTHVTEPARTVRIAASMAATSYPHITAEQRGHPFGVLYRLVRTEDRAAPLIARLVLGFVIFPHGAQKLLGWFGGGGVSGTITSFGAHYHLPSMAAILVMCAEFFGSIGLVLGLLGRVAAFGIACVMVGAIALVHSHVGFFMNWTGKEMGEGFEYHLLALALALIVMVAGSGKASIDRALTQRT